MSNYYSNTNINTILTNEIITIINKFTYFVKSELPGSKTYKLQSCHEHVDIRRKKKRVVGKRTGNSGNGVKGL